MDMLIEEADVFLSNLGQIARKAETGAPAIDQAGVDGDQGSGVPHYPPGALSDVATGTNLASAILAGLVKRSISGEGSVVGTSQVQTMMWLQTIGIGFAANLDRRMARFDLRNAASPLLSIYQTSDGWISIGALDDAQWRQVAETMNLRHMLDDQRFSTVELLIRNSDQATPVLLARFQEESTDHWWTLFRKAGIWVSPVNRYDDLATDPHILENNYVVGYPDGSVGVPVPFDVDSFAGMQTTGSGYGEDTDAVLTQLGYDEAALINLRAAGAIW